MTALDEQIARLKAEYQKLPLLVRAQGAAFFSELLGFADAVQVEARAIRELIDEVR